MNLRNLPRSVGYSAGHALGYLLGTLLAAVIARLERLPRRAPGAELATLDEYFASAHDVFDEDEEPVTDDLVAEFADLLARVDVLVAYLEDEYVSEFEAGLEHFYGGAE